MRVRKVLKCTTEKTCGAKTVPLWWVEPFFSLICMFRKNMAPPSEVAPFSKTKFCWICQKKGWKRLHFSQSGTVLAPPWHHFGSTPGAVGLPKGTKQLMGWRLHLIQMDQLTRVELFWIFFRQNSSTFEGGTKIVPRVELSYAQWNGSRGGAVIATLFSQWPISLKF